ncbi:TolC family protein [Hyphococcus sp.]|jgi:adhesin transport system outer membrane protein|uniref:TolC family protein n=1 Tax=Hyphococcus sp. TaxID=2038636 RepID=UPI003D121007
MIRLQTILLSGAAFCAVVQNSAVATPEDPKYYGSVYPTETVEPVRQASLQEPPLQTVEQPASRSRPRAGIDPKLEKALGAAGYLVSQENTAADFNAAVRRAVGRHPAYHAQAANLDEAGALRRQAKSALYPQLSTQLRGDYSLTRDFAADTDNVVESLRPREQFTAGVSASQLIFDGGATINRIRSARSLDEEYRNALETRINDLALNALTAYHDVAAHQALAAFSRDFIKRQERILGDVKERERLGAGSKADVYRAEARLAAARARLAEINESKRLADVRYEEFFSEPPPLLARPAFDTPDVTGRNDTIATALEVNPEIAAAEARADARQADFKAAQSSRLPEVRLSVDAVKYDVFDTGDDFDVRAGVTVNYNIFGGGARAAEISLARSRAKREQFNEAQVKQDIAREAAVAYERLQGADERLAALGDAVIAHDVTRDLVLERYKLSRGDLIDVLQAENDYFEAGVAYVIALSGRDMANYSLMEHTGDLLRLFSPQNEYQNGVSGAFR